MSAPLLADFEARLAAQTVFDRPVALEAGAGTGKTATLVARIVAWCVGPGWDEAGAAEPDDGEVAGRVLEGVVAITFTEAAAAEMAARVAATLAELQRLEPLPEDPRAALLPGLYRGALQAPAAEIHRRAGALLTQLERLRVSTIHAFARSILARYPVEAGVRPGFEVDADGSAVRDLVEEVVGATLPPAYGSREPAVLQLAEAGFGPAEITEAVLTLDAAGVPAGRLEHDPFEETSLQRLLQQLRTLLLQCGPDAAEYSKQTKKRTKKVGAGGQLLDAVIWELEHLDAGTSLERVRAIAELANDPSLANGWGKLKEWAGGALNNPKPQAVSEEEFSLRISEALPLLEICQHMDPGLYRAAAAVYGPILRRVEAEKGRRGVLGFGDLLRRARALLENFPEIRREIRREIRQLLVDEMQDTDPEQARIVELLAVEHDGGPLPCLFLVGDPKQSIYAFRGADFSAYRRLVGAIEKADQGRVERLTVNFRSVPPILAEVEQVMAPLMDEGSELQAPFQPLEPCPHQRSNPGFEDGGRRPVEHWVVVPPKSRETGRMSTELAAEREAEAVARDVAELHRRHGVPYEEMAILMRSSTHLDAFLENLRRLGIPYQVGRDRSYYRTREVAESMALLRVVLDPTDIQAFLAVLRSVFVGVPDAALVPLWREGLPRLAASLRGPDLDPELERALAHAAHVVDRDVQPRLPKPGLGPLAAWPRALLHFLQSLARLRASFRNDPPDRFLERLRHEMLPEPLAAARYPGAYRLANVERLLLELEEALERAPDPARLLAWLRRLGRERPDQASARPRSDLAGVRVLTVHGAKGLGFDHVWLVRTGGAPGNRHRASSTAALRNPLKDEWALTLAGVPAPEWAETTAVRDDMEKAEAVRVLYVALTRARRRLVTVNTPKYSKKSDWHAEPGSQLELLSGRKGGWWMDPEDVKAANTFKQGPVLWRLIDKAAEEPLPPTAPPEPSAPRPTVERCQSDLARLESRRRRAEARQERPWDAPMSREAHRELGEAVAAAVEGAETPEGETAVPGAPVTRDVATAVGTAVHRVLEHFDLEAADPDAELERRRGEAEAWLAVAVADIPAARERLAGLLESVRTGPLWARWLGLKPHVLARELPVLLPPKEDDGPVGALTGRVDLVYLDPETCAPVVVDYKTDDPQMIEERTAVYAAQLAFYAEAVWRALDLPTRPRTELWFLAAGRVVRVQEAGRT